MKPSTIQNLVDRRLLSLGQGKLSLGLATPNNLPLVTGDGFEFADEQLVAR